MAWPLEEKWELQENPIPSSTQQTILGSLDFMYTTETPVKDKYLNTWLHMDYEMQVGTKLDYLFFESTRSFQSSEIQMLKNQCEEERTQILTILMLSLENPRLAGYMVTGNRSMFLETDGSLAWLYSCPLISLPLHVMSNCYDKIPIFCEGQIQFVDPITRQTYPNAYTQNCIDRIKIFSNWICKTKIPGFR